MSEADVTPISSLCLNKSCSRSFYLHMLTGTSEFPEERCREKKMEGEKNRGREPEKAVPITAAKGLSGLFSSHGVIPIKEAPAPIHFFFLFTLAQKVIKYRKVLKLQKQVKQTCLQSDIII